MLLPFVTFLGVLRDPFRGVVGDLHLGDQKVTTGRSWRTNPPQKGIKNLNEHQPEHVLNFVMCS